MKYEFSNKKDLEQLVVALKNKLSKGILVVDESIPKDDFFSADYLMPDAVKKFFLDNSVKACNLLTELPDPVFIKDNKRQWFFVNKAFCRFFGVSFNEIYGKKSHALFPKRKAVLFSAEDRRVLATGKESILESEIINSTGHSRTIIAKKTLIHDVNNTPYILGVFNEVTSLKKIESSIKQEKTELESQIKIRTFLLTSTVEKFQEEINQRKKIEQALIQEEDKFRNIIEQASEGIALIDSIGRIIEWNNSLAEITGIPKEHAIGKNTWDIEFQMTNPGKRNKEYYQLLKKNSLISLKKEEIPKKLRNIEGNIIRADGKQRFVNFTSFTIKTQNAFYIGRIVRDVTEQKKAVIDLQRSEAQHRAIFENSSIAILIINPENGRIITANEKAAEIYGYPLGIINGMSMKQISKDFSHDQQQLKMTGNNNTMRNFETIHLNKKGDEINMLINGSTIDYKGIKAIMNFNRDITELKNSEKARETVYRISQLTHTATNTEDLYKSIHNIISEIIPANNFYIALYDESSDMVSFPYYVDEKDAQPQPRKLRRGLTEYVLRHGKPILTNPTLLEQLEMSAEIEIIGSLSDVWLGVPLITHNKVIGVIALQSYSKGIQYSALERDLLVYVSEQIANQIFKKQAEEQIILGKTKAEESDRLKTALIANMNHDIRTPMTGILGFASLLKNQIKDPATNGMIDNIIESGNKLMSTINSILQLSQIEASQKPLNIITGDLSKYVEMSLEQFEPKAKQKNLFVVRKYHDYVFATFNENYFSQIMNNLIINAVSFTEKGGITVKTGFTDFQEKEFAFVSIEDTGIGISENNFNLIFQEFRQVSEGLNRKYDGSGLGLSLCKKMAELMGGKILIESQLGKGSVFTILLPTATPQNLKKSQYAGEMEIIKPLLTHKHKILVVDDNKINGELIFAYLKNDYEVDIAKTGLLAIELVKRAEYDIVFMDINLGEGINGILAAKEIKKMNKNIPIIAMTGYSSETDIKQIMNHSFTSYILKPVDRISLLKVLERTIRKKTM